MTAAEKLLHERAMVVDRRVAELDAKLAQWSPGIPPQSRQGQALIMALLERVQIVKQAPEAPDPPDRCRIQDAGERMSDEGHPYRTAPACEHGVTFDPKESAGLGASEVRRCWPRLDGACPLGCGYSGIAYASMMHCVAGDW